MNKVLAIFRRDLQRITHNFVAVIVTLGVCIIPSLYAWFNILANWDPYKNTQQIPIAIINDDEGTTTDSTGEIVVGDKICDKLKENDSLDWKFVDRQTAVDGVKSAKYYAAIEIPQDFSKDLASILTGNLDRPDLIYYVNEKTNAIAPKVTDTGAATIEQQVNEEFVATVSKVIAEDLDKLGVKLTDSSEVQKDNAIDSLISAQTLVDNLADTLGQTNTTCTKAHQAIKDAKNTLDELDTTSAGINTTFETSLDLLTVARSSSTKFYTTSSQALISGAGGLGAASVTTSADIAKVASQLQKAQAKVDGAIADMQSIYDSQKATVDRLQKLLENLDEGSFLHDKIQEKIDTIQASLDKEKQTIDMLKAKQEQLKEQIATLEKAATDTNAFIGTTAASVLDLQKSLAGTTMPQVSSAMDDFSSIALTTGSALGAISPTITQTKALLGQLEINLSQAQSTITNTKNSLSAVSQTLKSCQQDLLVLQSSFNFSSVKHLFNLDQEDVSEFMGSPVKIADQVLFPVKNYGSGVAPFYTNLALWVGGFVLVAIYKLEVDEEGIGHYKPWQGYFGRWMLLNLMGMLQALICCVGDLVIGIQCESVAGFILAGLIASFVYVNIIYALSIAFKHIGKALGVLLVILQIPGSSGMYPIEMMPDFFRNLCPWLPFTYGINAMRECIAGFYGNYYSYNLFMLLLFVVPSLIIGVGMRRHLLNLNSLFDRKLAQTDMMIAERVGIDDVHFRLSSIIKAILSSEGYKQAITQRAANFELKYPTLIKRGFVLMFVIPIVLLILLFTIDAKIQMLILWIVSILIIITFLILVEYFHERVTEKTDLADMTQDQLYDLLGDELRQNYMAFAPLEKLLHSKNRSEAARKAEAIHMARLAERSKDNKAYPVIKHMRQDADETQVLDHPINQEGGESQDE